MNKLPIFIGYDSKEVIAYEVLAHSIESLTTIPVELIALELKQLTDCGMYTRVRGPLESTEFSFTRFLVPLLCAYRGRAIFMDCDMLFRADIAELVTAFDHSENQDKAVLVCQHDYTPKTDSKFLGQTQTKYPRKNWSSLMLFNNSKCRALTREYVNTATGLDLHRFNWLPDEAIGALPLEWNWLVGEYPSNPNAKNLHFTLGGPWFKDCEVMDEATEWIEARDYALTSMVMRGE